MLNTLVHLTPALNDTLSVPVDVSNGANAFGFVVALFFAATAIAAYFNDIKPVALIMGTAAAGWVALDIFADPIITIDAPAVQSQIAADTGVVLNTDTLTETVRTASGSIGDKVAFTDGDVLGYITVVELSSDGAVVEYMLNQ